MSSGDALIGCTGFVGRNLAAAHGFESAFNSQTMDASTGSHFSLAVCAAAPATMWAANKNPDGDHAIIQRLIGQLGAIRADRFVLISTIAVLDNAAGGYDETSARYETGKAYGRNRRMLEEACQEIFSDCTILRLPALFGQGLKKNFLFDLLNPIPSFLTPDDSARLLAALPEPSRAALAACYSWNEGLALHECDRAAVAMRADRAALEETVTAAGHAAASFAACTSTYQFYGLQRLWSDIQTLLDGGPDVVHLAPQPLSAAVIHRTLTGRDFNSATATPYHEDMRSAYAALLGGTGGYTQQGDGVMTALKAFYDLNVAS